MSYNPNGSIYSRQFHAGPSGDDYTSPNSLVGESSNAEAGGAVTWTSFNQPSTISGANGTSSASFYGPNHQRWQQQAYYAGSAETTIYIGGLLEKIVTPSGTVYRHFVPAGNSVVVYLPGSTPTIQYATGDHLGSTATITDANGNLILAESFSPWGARRSPTNWTLRQSASDATLLSTTMRQGFTAHEHLDNLELINMNGRAYQGAAFMSPDPHITDPTNPQDYNRFTYVRNSPLTFLDPSGFYTTVCVPFDPLSNGTSIGADNDQASATGQDGIAEVSVVGQRPQICYTVPDLSDLGNPSVKPVTVQSVGGISLPPSNPPCASAMRPSKTNMTPVVFTDDQGNPVIGPDGFPMVRPAGFDPHFFTAAGAADAAAHGAVTFYANSLANFRIGGPWDAQRANGLNFPMFRSFASVAIGLYAGANGKTANQINAVAALYASVASTFPGEVMDSTFPSLPAVNVDNTELGVALATIGGGLGICTPGNAATGGVTK